MDLELSNTAKYGPLSSFLMIFLFISLSFVSVLYTDHFIPAQSRSRLPIVTYICVSGGRLRELPSHVHRVQPFRHEDERSPQLRKAEPWICLRKQSKSIALAVVGST